MARRCRFDSPDEILDLFEEYKKEKTENKEYQSLSGFCVYIGSYRDYLTQLAADKPMFHNAVNAIREYFALYTVDHAQKSEKNQALNIFLLKNYGYKDKTEQDINITGSVDISDAFKKLNK